MIFTRTERGEQSPPCGRDRDCLNRLARKVEDVHGGGTTWCGRPETFTGRLVGLERPPSCRRHGRRSSSKAPRYPVNQALMVNEM